MIRAQGTAFLLFCHAIAVPFAAFVAVTLG